MGLRTTVVLVGVAVAALIGTPSNAQVAQSDFNSSAAVERAQSKNGQPYIYGSLNDCSGHLSDILSVATGQPVRFVTGSDFGAMGWQPGFDPDGFNIGTNGGIGADGHMAATLFGVNVEADASNGVQYGGAADGALDFPIVWHWPGASAGNATSGPPAASYTVAPGDWLTTIAPRVGITVERLYELNPAVLQNPNLIMPGQVLKLG